MRNKRYRINPRRQKGGPFDLFGEIPVLTTDLDDWMALVAPRISAWRRDWYIRWYDVPGKIRAAKLAGAWPPTPEAQSTAR